MSCPRISTGSPGLDDLVGGGLEKKLITELVGGPGTGKSTLATLAAVSCLKCGNGVVFIDTEGFSIERFRQIAGEESYDLAGRLFLFEPADFVSQGVMIGSAEKVLKENDVGLIILDSATGLYRAELERGREAIQQLTRQMVHLLGLARRYDLACLITNQVYHDPAHNRLVGLGGTALAHIAKVILQIDRAGDCRRATVIKHLCLPEGGFYDFRIVREGIASCEGENEPARSEDS